MECVRLGKPIVLEQFSKHFTPRNIQTIHCVALSIQSETIYNKLLQKQDKNFELIFLYIIQTLNTILLYLSESVPHL